MKVVYEAANVIDAHLVKHALEDAGITPVALMPHDTDRYPSQEIDALRTRVPAGTPVALLVGNEGHGLSDGTLARCPLRARIRMADGADSLNVATALAAWELHGRNAEERKRLNQAQQMLVAGATLTLVCGGVYTWLEARRSSGPETRFAPRGGWRPPLRSPGARGHPERPRPRPRPLR